MTEAAESTETESRPDRESPRQAASAPKVRLVRPWFHRLYLTIPLPSGVTACALFVIAATIVSVPTLLGWPGSGNALSATRSPLLLVAVMFSYATWVSFLIHDRTQRDHLSHLDDLTVSPAVYRAQLQGTTHFRPWVLRLSLAGAAVPLLSGIPSGRTSTLFLEPDSTLVWWIATRTIYWCSMAGVLSTGIAAIARYVSLGRYHANVDLLDLDLLAPWPRGGLRAALGVLGSAIIFFPVSVVYGMTSWLNLLLYSPFLVLGVAAFLLPNVGIRSRIRKAKIAELRRVRAAIAGKPGALTDSPVAARQERLSLADLLAYQERIESLREWPMDARAFRRFGLYMLIPLGSWLGSALVERGLDLLWK